MSFPIRLGVRCVIHNNICNPCGAYVSRCPHECGQWVWSKEEKERNALEQARLVEEYKEELDEWNG